MRTLILSFRKTILKFNRLWNRMLCGCVILSGISSKIKLWSCFIFNVWLVHYSSHLLKHMLTVVPRSTLCIEFNISYKTAKTYRNDSQVYVIRNSEYHFKFVFVLVSSVFRGTQYFIVSVGKDSICVWRKKAITKNCTSIIFPWATDMSVKLSICS